MPAPLRGGLKSVLQLTRLEELCSRAADAGDPLAFCPRILELLEANVACSQEDIERIPSTGPVLLVSNHPFGMMEGIVLSILAGRRRSDVRFLANSLLQSIPALAERVIPVDVFGTGRQAALRNALAFRTAERWLTSGGLLSIFPSGEVSSLQWKKLVIQDPEWSPSVARIARRSGATVVPVFFAGANSPAFHMAGLVHPRLRTAMLPRELLAKQRHTVEVRVGRPIAPKLLAQFEDDSSLTEFLKRRTYSLGDRLSAAVPRNHSGTGIAPGADASALAMEVEALPAGALLLEHQEFQVYLARARQIPQLLQEIGRQREIAFRQVGEGTGKPLDLDEFDSHYLHLFLWNRERQEIAGGYRLKGTDEALAEGGTRDLYTCRLFHLHRRLFDSMGPALELGRSFVRPEYQRRPQPLLLLWQGIGRYIARHPRYRYLYGPVSISRSYGRASQEAIVSFLKSRCSDPDRVPFVRPRRPFRPRPIDGRDARALAASLATIDQLSDLVADLEPDQKGVPVLLRQYLNLGGRVLAFSVDPEFSSVLDGLIVVDLAHTAPRLLQRYLGGDGAAAFASHHAVGSHKRYA